MKSTIVERITGISGLLKLTRLTPLKMVVPLALILFAAFASAEPSVYVVTTNQQFGTVDLRTGAFHPIGPNTPEGQSNLVWGPRGTLLSLTYSGNLESIDPATGVTTVIGATGLGYNAFGLAEVDGRLFATDFSNNLYRVDERSGVASLLRATGMPPDPAIPFSVNADGTVNLCDETIYGLGGRLYATFDAFKIDPNSLAITTVVDPDLYEINPRTGRARRVASTSLNLGSSVEVEGRFYAFKWVLGSFTELGPQVSSELVALDLEDGRTRSLTAIDPAAGGIVGTAPVRHCRWKETR